MNKTPEELAEKYALNQECLVELPYCKRTLSEAFTRELSNAFLAGYEAGHAKWVSVKERLPQKETMVLTYSTDKSCRWGNIAFHGRWEVERDGMEWTEEVTHWMPLPETPRSID